MSAVLEDEEEETEEQRYQRFFGPAESSTEDDASDEEEAPPAPPRLAIESEASALLAKLIGEVLAEAKTRPERETARLACAAAGSFLAQIPGAAGAFERGNACWTPSGWGTGEGKRRGPSPRVSASGPCSAPPW